MATIAEVRDVVTDVLCEALGVDEEDVTPDKTLAADLGAESIDFLDIVFRLEQNFDIKVDRRDLYPEDILADPQFVVDGKITEEGLALLSQRMPFLDLDGFRKNPMLNDFDGLLTVDAICKYVASRISDRH